MFQPMPAETLLHALQCMVYMMITYTNACHHAIFKQACGSQLHVQLK